MSETTFIYGLFDPRNCQLRYIGKSNNPERRLRQHITEARHSRKHRYLLGWIKQLLSEGLEPAVEVLEECTQDIWQESEKAWIADCKEYGLRLVNGTDGGDGPFSFTSEARENISITHKGKKFSGEHKESMKRAWARRKELYGNNGFTDDGLNRIRTNQEKWRSENREEFDRLNQAKRGKPRSEETKQKLREANLGKKISEETRIKISEASKGKIPPMKGKKWSPEMIELFRERSLGRLQSEETRKKRSETFKDKKIGIGRQVSEETKNKLRSASLNRTHSEETKKKIGIANKGKIISEETRQKLRAANVGKTLSDETRKKVSEASKRMWEKRRGERGDA
jgi:hypothetical protein